MNDWVAGYRAALTDIQRLVHHRGPASWLDALIEDLLQDSRVIEHELDNRLQKRRLAAAREALPLFEDKP